MSAEERMEVARYNLTHFPRCSICREPLDHDNHKIKAAVPVGPDDGAIDPLEKFRNVWA